MSDIIMRMFGFDKDECIRDNRCVPSPIGCGGKAVDFRDEISRKEYKMSGLCQACQDAFFDTPNPS